MCAHVQASVWDVDGTGMQFVDDPEVDLGIRKVRCCIYSMLRMYVVLGRLQCRWCMACVLPCWVPVAHSVIQFAYVGGGDAESGVWRVSWGCGHSVRDGAIHFVALLRSAALVSMADEALWFLRIQDP